MNNVKSMYLYNKYVILNYKLIKKENYNLYSREIYSSTTGMFYLTIEDKIEDINFPSGFSHKIGNSLFNISSNKIIGFEV